MILRMSKSFTSLAGYDDLGPDLVEPKRRGSLSNSNPGGEARRRGSLSSQKPTEEEQKWQGDRIQESLVRNRSFNGRQLLTRSQEGGPDPSSQGRQRSRFGTEGLDQTNAGWCSRRDLLTQKVDQSRRDLILNILSQQGDQVEDAAVAKLSKSTRRNSGRRRRRSHREGVNTSTTSRRNSKTSNANQLSRTSSDSNLMEQFSSWGDDAAPPFQRSSSTTRLRRASSYNATKTGKSSSLRRHSSQDVSRNDSGILLSRVPSSSDIIGSSSKTKLSTGIKRVSSEKSLLKATSWNSNSKEEKAAQGSSDMKTGLGDAPRNRKLKKASSSKDLVSNSNLSLVKTKSNRQTPDRRMSISSDGGTRRQVRRGSSSKELEGSSSKPRRDKSCPSTRRKRSSSQNSLIARSPQNRALRRTSSSGGLGSSSEKKRRARRRKTAVTNSSMGRDELVPSSYQTKNSGELPPATPSDRMMNVVGKSTRSRSSLRSSSGTAARRSKSQPLVHTKNIPDESPSGTTEKDLSMRSTSSCLKKFMLGTNKALHNISLEELSEDKTSRDGVPRSNTFDDAISSTRNKDPSTTSSSDNKMDKLVVHDQASLDMDKLVQDITTLLTQKGKDDAKERILALLSSPAKKTSNKKAATTGPKEKPPEVVIEELIQDQSSLDKLAQDITTLLTQEGKDDAKETILALLSNPISSVSNKATKNVDTTDSLNVQPKNGTNELIREQSSLDKLAKDITTVLSQDREGGETIPAMLSNCSSYSKKTPKNVAATGTDIMQPKSTDVKLPMTCADELSGVLSFSSSSDSRDDSEMRLDSALPMLKRLSNNAAGAMACRSVLSEDSTICWSEHNWE